MPGQGCPVRRPKVPRTGHFRPLGAGSKQRQLRCEIITQTGGATDDSPFGLVFGLLGMDTLKPYLEILHSIADIFAIVASGIAIYIFFAKGEELAQAFRLLVNFSYQTTLAELKEKLERLNEYKANDPNELVEIRNILHEVAGQIKGNPHLMQSVPTLAQRIESAAQSKKFAEASKRALVSEIREVLRNMNVRSVTGEKE